MIEVYDIFRSMISLSGVCMRSMLTNGSAEMMDGVQISFKSNTSYHRTSTIQAQYHTSTLSYHTIHAKTRGNESRSSEKG